MYRALSLLKNIVPVCTHTHTNTKRPEDNKLNGDSYFPWLKVIHMISIFFLILRFIVESVHHNMYYFLVQNTIINIFDQKSKYLISSFGQRYFRPFISQDTLKCYQ